MASVGTCGATRGQVVVVAMLLAGAARSLERGEDWGPEWGGQLLRVPRSQDWTARPFWTPTSRLSPLALP